MASIEARVKKLEKKALSHEKTVKKLKADLAKAKSDAAKLKKAVAALEKEKDDIIKWIEDEAAWSLEVTNMLRLIDWVKLSIAFPAGGGTNPPQTPPDWPVN